MAKRDTPFEDAFFVGELNRLVGSGGELLIKGADNDPASTVMEVGDRLIGIGVTHSVESLSRPPGLDSYRIARTGTKAAMRAFRVTAKSPNDQGFNFAFAPLNPREYSALISQVSEGEVEIPADTIPVGTIILSFVDPTPTYTLANITGSPGSNWARSTAGERHWNVGVGKDDDYWIAGFPADDIGLLRLLDPAHVLGTIRFGLSLLEGSRGWQGFEPVPNLAPGTRETHHHFVLEGQATGTAGLDTPFPIGLRTQIRFHPIDTAT